MDTSGMLLRANCRKESSWRCILDRIRPTYSQEIRAEKNARNAERARFPYGRDSGVNLSLFLFAKNWALRVEDQRGLLTPVDQFAKFDDWELGDPPLVKNLMEELDEPSYEITGSVDHAENIKLYLKKVNTKEAPLNENSVLVDGKESLSPVMSCQIADLAHEETPQMYVTSGRGPRSTLKVLERNLEVREIAVAKLPGVPIAVWTVKKRVVDDYDAYIVVSFYDSTMVLSIGETIEEVAKSGFLRTTPTLSCSVLGDDSFLQIYPDGMRHIRSDRRVNEWKAPGTQTIQRCAVNERQVVIALTGGELVYFEMDQAGQFGEYSERKEMSSDVSCMTLGPVPSGEQGSRFLAVGLIDKTLRIMSLDPSDYLAPLSVQALPAMAESLRIDMGGDDARSVAYLNIGLQSGVLLRTVWDMTNGGLSDAGTYRLGEMPARLFPMKMHGRNALLAMSISTWLLYFDQARYCLAQLGYEMLACATGFSSEQCPEGIVATSVN